MMRPLVVTLTLFSVNLQRLEDDTRNSQLRRRDLPPSPIEHPLLWLRTGSIQQEETGCKLWQSINGHNYSGDLNNKHLNNGNTWIVEFYKSGIQIICYSDAWYLLLTGQENSEQIVCAWELHSCFTPVPYFTVLLYLCFSLSMLRRFTVQQPFKSCLASFG